MLSIAGLKGSDGAEDYGREWNPYVTVRGGWLFGTAEFEQWMIAANGASSDWQIRNIKNAWSGSVEFGQSYDDRVFVGLELGYFTGKAKNFMGRNYIAGALGRVDTTWKANGKIGNYFGACNITLRQDVGARGFLYGGIGAGIARSKLSVDVDETVTVTIPPAPAVVVNVPLKISKSKWRFLGQAFAGFGVYLNENWQLTAGYRLRYLPGSFQEGINNDAIGLKYGASVKQDIIHAAEVGLMYQF